MAPPAATAAGARTLQRPVAPRAPRRVSGPAARNGRGAAAGRTRARSTAVPANDPFILRALLRTQQLADSRFLDRLIRGQLWIPLVAAGLMGIVFMQVSMLKFNAGISRAVQSASTLESQNAMLRAGVSSMESGSRIGAVTRQIGMVVPAEGSARYVTAKGRDVAALAAHRMTAPDPNAILRGKAASAAAQVAAGTTATTTAPITAAAAPAGATTPAATTPVATTPPSTATTAQTPAAATGAAPAAAPTTASTTPAASTTTTSGTGTTAATGSGTSGGVAAAPTGAAAAPAQTSQPATVQPQQTTSGGAVAPAQG
jgi:hypothetical protein